MARVCPFAIYMLYSSILSFLLLLLLLLPVCSAYISAHAQIAVSQSHFNIIILLYTRARTNRAKVKQTTVVKERNKAEERGRNMQRAGFELACRLAGDETATFGWTSERCVRQVNDACLQMRLPKVFTLFSLSRISFLFDLTTNTTNKDVSIVQDRTSETSE